MKGLRTVEHVAVTGLLACAISAAQAPEADASKMLLREGWTIQSSDDVREAGDVISTPWYNPRGWYTATLPSTVFSALVDARVYPDPYTGMNLRSIPGVSYPIGTNSSNLLMPPDSPFRRSWWYRMDFELPPDYDGRAIWLGFDGINFRANVWLNGRQIASADKMAGAWRLFEFNITADARPGATNTLAVEVFPSLPHDLAITFVDWNPQPPDKNLGLWRDVSISATGPVALRYPSVITDLNLPSTDLARLTVRTEVVNAEGRVVEGVLRGKIENREFSQPVRLGPHETQAVRFTPDEFPELNVKNPRLWWPVQFGDQNLYPLDLRFEVDGEVSDSQSIEFGIREVTSELDGNGHLVFSVNGEKILIRGAGYSFDMMLRSTPQQQENALRYVRDMNLNAVRLEGKIEDEHFLELCDRYGILVMPGWCCCDHWERWRDWDAEDVVISAESLRDQLRRLARHPSVFTWMNGSDNPPTPEIEQMYLDIIREVEWPNPVQSSATEEPSTVSGDTGVKMNGPYEYIAPSYWLTDTSRGGAFGFATEVGPGPTPPPIESLRRMLPEDRLWPINPAWDYHAGGGAFSDIRVFTEALNARYGESASVEEYARKAQVMAYEGERAMFEAFGRNKFTSTGVIQWMLNNAWPSMIWHLYDWYMRPGGSYFGAKIGCEPLHVQYSYDDRSIVVVNSQLDALPGVQVTAKVYNLDMAEKWSQSASVDVSANSSTRVFEVPEEIRGLSTTYFVHLTLADASGNIVSRNFYWLSTTPETLDWDASTWYHTPTKTFADYTALEKLPQVDLDATAVTETQGTDRVTTVTLTNPGKSLAFAVHLKVSAGAGGEEFLPVLWQDNYFPLLPGESRQVTATYAATPPGRGRRGGGSAAAPVVEIDGWNVKPEVVTQ